MALDYLFTYQQGNPIDRTRYDHNFIYTGRQNIQKNHVKCRKMYTS